MRSPLLPARYGLVSLLCSAILGCTATTTRLPGNAPISAIDEQGGYRRLDATSWDSIGDTMIILSFSGGGTRAAALSYGVMQELRDTIISPGEKATRALDEVDTISSVSGGSFTAAYYGAFRERLFEDYEEAFLRKGVQSDLIGRLMNPINWIRNLAPGVDRTDMAIDYYDQTLFRGATFNDIKRHGPPFIEINATDLVTGLRFSFTQERFDWVCSDLGSFPLARAVTASSAVPGLFPTVVLSNHADQCDLSDSKEWQLMQAVEASAGGEVQQYMTRGFQSYRDTELRPYIHLVDGGISDNLGLRAMTDRFEYMSDYLFTRMAGRVPRNFVIIQVNAEVKRDRSIEQSEESPSLAATMGTLTNTRLNRENQETLDKLQEAIDEFSQRAAVDGMPTRVYFSEVSFDSVRETQVSRYLNSLPTSLELDEEQVDRLIAAGRLLLRHEPSFKQFKKDNDGHLTDGAISSYEMCRMFSYDHCPGQLTDGY